jgi:VanZ family protein
MNDLVPAISPFSRPLRLAIAWYALAACMLIAVAVVSLAPMPATGVSDKLAHLLTYSVLAGWFALIARDRVVLGWSMLGLIGYGMLIELLQAQTGYRYAEWADVLANSGGCVAGSLLYFTPLRRLMWYIDGNLASLLRR